MTNRNDADKTGQPLDSSRPPAGSVLVDWFGEWHVFHDGEVLELHLERERASYFDVWAAVQGPLNPATGCFTAEKQCIIRVWMHEVREVALTGFGQNVLNELSFQYRDDHWDIHLDACVGIGGHIVCERVDFSITPGPPPRRWRQEARGAV